MNNGLIVKAKEFKAALNKLELEMFKDKGVAVQFDQDLSLPSWIFMRISSYFLKAANELSFGEMENLKLQGWLKQLEKTNFAHLKDERIVIVARPGIPPEVYAKITQVLLPLVKTLMYGAVGLPTSNMEKEMKVLIFNGAIEPVVQSTSAKISSLLKNKFDALTCETEVFNITDSNIPLFELEPETLPAPVVAMNKQFRAADIHIWITPLYHGGMTGAMKNCLDWLEYGKTENQIYLEGKVIGFACWAGGVQAINGINAMDTVAKALRAWTAPLSVPMQYADLYTSEGSINPHYQERLELLAEVVAQTKLG